MRIVYEAVDRKLATGHSAATEYEIVVYGWTVDPQFDMVGPENESLDGTIERDLLRTTTEWTVRTDLIEAGQDLENFEEFLFSVAAGESFTFDPESDQAGVDVRPLSCRMQSRRFRRSRPAPGRFQFQFTVRELP